MRFNAIATSLLIGMLLAIHPGTWAQEKNVSRGNLQWSQYYLKTKVSDKISVGGDASYRWTNAFGSASQYLVRGTVFYHPNDRITAAAGLAHFGFYSGGDVHIREFRPYQEATFKQRFGKVRISHRLRFEERFLSDQDPEGWDSRSMILRSRYMLTAKIPLVRSFPGKPDMGLSLEIGDEIFVNAGKDVIYNIFDQNRAFAGPTLKVSKSLSVNLIYVYLFGARNAPAEFIQSNLFWLRIRHKLDFSKRER